VFGVAGFQRRLLRQIQRFDRGRRRCANWLRYGIQPDRPSPGRCPSKAHDREHLGIGGRCVLVSRDGSGKTLSEHRADRSAVVREADLERMATDVLSPDGLPATCGPTNAPTPPPTP
jgi:Replication initiator protein, pSAM2